MYGLNRSTIRTNGRQTLKTSLNKHVIFGINPGILLVFFVSPTCAESWTWGW